MSEKYTLSDIEALREEVKPYLTGKRYLHTLAVEREAAHLGEIYLPEKVNSLRAAALLHDITKKCDFEKQLQYCAKFGIIVSDYDRLAPKTFHAKTAAALIGEAFPRFDDEEIVSAVRWHTTGHDEMTVFESIVYLADYIEDTRSFPDCVELRRFFYDSLAAGLEKNKVFVDTMIRSFDMTIKNLVEEGALLDCDTVGARNYFLSLGRDVKTSK